jgi:prepilin-type N-terminal cleavage/methylation domain-containing protein
MKSVATHPRRGFTLVELLMVITIIGMLMALVVAGAQRAIVTANVAKVTTEVGMLDTAVQNYKNDIGGSYPPDCSFLGTTQTWVDARNNRILAHLSRAFPRFYPGTYDNLRTTVMNAFANSTQHTYAATTPNTTSSWGDINNIDQAEALVFWLGGPPAPPMVTNGIYAYRLLGFSANKLRPFNLDDASRIKGPYEFQEQRLGDADGDGWPEYYPAIDSIPQPSGGASSGNPTPPYLYFDAGTYATVTAASFTSYPISGQYPPVSSGKMPTQPANAYALLWGGAIPYARGYTAATKTSSAQLTWFNPEKFQIISASIDSQYSNLVSSSTQPFRLFPAGTNYTEADYDNVTNFSNGRLQDQMP